MVLVIHGGRVMGFWWGAWCTATKGSGVVVWGGGEILIKTYPGTNPCRLSPSPPRFIQPYGTPSSPSSPSSPCATPCLLPRLSRAQPVTLMREYFDRYSETRSLADVDRSVRAIFYSPRNNVILVGVDLARQC